MKIYDISQEVLSCAVYPGDAAPTATAVKRISAGDSYNLSNLSMCAHNGTHIDAPFHFLEGGDTIERIALDKTVGECYVCRYEGELSEAIAQEIISRTTRKMLVIGGNAVITASAARVFVSGGVTLIGVESQSVGDASAPMEVHKILLNEKVVLLEGLRLNDVTDGEYLLCAQPINLAGLDGAPCRAILIKL